MSDPVLGQVWGRHRVLLGLTGVSFFSPFGPWCLACGVLVPQPEIELVPLAVEAQSLNYWTTREVP